MKHTNFLPALALVAVMGISNVGLAAGQVRLEQLTLVEENVAIVAVANDSAAYGSYGGGIHSHGGGYSSYSSYSSYSGYGGGVHSHGGGYSSYSGYSSVHSHGGGYSSYSGYSSVHSHGGGYSSYSGYGGVHSHGGGYSGYGSYHFQPSSATGTSLPSPKVKLSEVEA